MGTTPSLHVRLLHLRRQKQGQIFFGVRGSGFWGSPGAAPQTRATRRGFNRIGFSTRGANAVKHAQQQRTNAVFTCLNQAACRRGYSSSRGKDRARALMRLKLAGQWKCKCVRRPPISGPPHSHWRRCIPSFYKSSMAAALRPCAREWGLASLYQLLITARGSCIPVSVQECGNPAQENSTLRRCYRLGCRFGLDAQRMLWALRPAAIDDEVPTEFAQGHSA